MEELAATSKLGIRIEKPVSERVGIVYYLLLILSSILIGATVWLLALEWFEEPIPSALRSLFT